MERRGVKQAGTDTIPNPAKKTKIEGKKVLKNSLQRPKVLIVGARTAGLTAAKFLTEHEIFDFDIFEARDRPGFFV